MDILNLTPGGFASNCYLVKCGNDAVLIDCTADAHRVSEALGDAKLHAILLTHGHFDHMLTVSRMQRELSAPLYLHARDAEFPTDARKNAFAAFFPQDVTYPPADHLLCGGECLTFGTLSVHVTHVPGHTGGCVLYRIGEALFTGDTIFSAGFGRTDLYGGDEVALRTSLALLHTLPPTLTIYPGHGESALLGDALDRLF